MTQPAVVSKDWQHTAEAWGAGACALATWLLLRRQTSNVIECEYMNDSASAMRYASGAVLIAVVIVLSYAGVWLWCKRRQAQRAALTGHAPRPNWWLVTTLGTTAAYVNVCLIYPHFVYGCPSHDYGFQPLIAFFLGPMCVIIVGCVMLLFSFCGMLADMVRDTVTGQP